MARTNSGKATESFVADALKQIADSNDFFDFQRLYDATSAGRIFAPQVGDFLFFMPTLHGVIEVKSTQHAYRLSVGAFSDGQRARLYKRLKAGGRVFVIVHHWKHQTWRVVNFADCYQAFNVESRASMDLRDYPTYPSGTQAVAALMESILNE